MRHRRSHTTSRLLKHLFCFAAAWTLCGPRTCAAQTVDESGHPDSMLVFAIDQEDNPALSARADQILVFGMNSKSNEGRFRLNAGTHRFCLEGGAGYFTNIVLLTDRGSRWPTTPFGSDCIQAGFPGGVITVFLQHGDQQRPGAGVTASVRVDPPILDPTSSATPLVNQDGSPVGGYWLMQDNNVTARGTSGLFMNLSTVVLTTVLTLRSQINDSFFIQFSSPKNPDASASPNAGSWGIEMADPASYLGTGQLYPQQPTFQLLDFGNYQVSAAVVAPGKRKTLQYRPNDQVFQGPVAALAGKGDTFQVILRYYPDGSTIGNLNPGEVAFYDQCNYQGRAAVFIPLLGPGQVSPPLHLSSLTSSFFPMVGTFKSVRLGAGAGAYWGENQSSLQGAVIGDDSCLAHSPESSLYVEPLLNVVLTARSLLKDASCASCNFSNQTFPAGTDLSGVNFSGATLSNDRIYDSNLAGANFQGATLYGTLISGSNLSGADFTGAKILSSELSGGASSGATNFSGATFSYARLGSALNGSNFSNAQMCNVEVSGTDPLHHLNLSAASFHLNEACLQSGYNLRYTELSVASDVGSDWKSVDLTGATIANANGLLLSTAANQLNLSQATLTGVNLQGAILDYANGLAGKNLTSVNFDHVSLQHVDLHDAVLYSANLTNSNLDGASLEDALLTKQPGTNLSSAQFSGAFMRNVNLFQAQLGGANFTGASFFSSTAAARSGCAQVAGSPFTPCATAEFSTMNDTDFDGAYLYGTDFSNSTVQGVHFSGAFLVGSRFVGAKLSSSSAGVGTGFTKALLQGANLSVATLPPSISFSNAYFDFSPKGNLLTFLVDNTFTGFPGFWETKGAAVCVTVSYSATQTPDYLPPTVSDTICPDGLTHNGGCASGGLNYWKSQASLPTKYTYSRPATYDPTPPSTPACSPSDYRWNF